MEWADVLHEEKCGGARPTWRDRIEEPKVGETYRVEDYLTGEVTYEVVTEENIRTIRWWLFSPDNDMYSVRKSVRN